MGYQRPPWRSGPAGIASVHAAQPDEEAGNSASGIAIYGFFGDISPAIHFFYNKLFINIVEQIIHCKVAIYRRLSDKGRSEQNPKISHKQSINSHLNSVSQVVVFWHRACNTDIGKAGGCNLRNNE